MTGDAYVCVDASLRERTNRYTLATDARAAGAALLATIEDDSLAVMLVRAGYPAGADPEPTPAEITSNRVERFIKLGQIRWFDGVATYTALATPDGVKRTDTDL